MGKKFIIFTVLLCVVSFLIDTQNVLAVNSGGTGSSGGGGSGSGIELGPGGQMGQSGPIRNLKAYVFQLVYKPEGGRERTVLDTVVAQCYNEESSAIWSAAEKNRRVDQYASSNGYGAVKRGSSSKLSRMACELSNGNDVDDMVAMGWLRQDDDTFVKEMLGEFNINPSEDMQEEQDQNPGRYDSYGYRILIKKLTTFCDTSTYSYCVVASRKDYSASRDNGYKFGSNCWEVGTQVSTQGDIFTTRDDIGIVAGNNVDSCSGSLRSRFNDPYDGLGYQIIWFTNPYENHDYEPDSFCGNCYDSGDGVSQSYTDVAADDMQSSLNSDDSNTSSYFLMPWTDTSESGNKILFQCRDEIKVKLPTDDKSRQVVPGRFFTIGLTEPWNNAIPNFDPIHVERERACRAQEQIPRYDDEGNFIGYTYEDITGSYNWNRYWPNDDFYQNREATGTERRDPAGTVDDPYELSYSTGEIKIGYEETNGNHEYDRTADSGEYELWADSERQAIEQENNILNVQNDYQLEEQLYQFVRLEDGLSVSEVPGPLYKDLGTANLPISYENKYDGSNEIAAKVQFLYELPENTNFQKVIENSNYFENANNGEEVEDIFQIASEAGSITSNGFVKGSLSDDEWRRLLNTSCASFCDVNGDACTSNSGSFNTCVNQKLENGGKGITNCTEEAYICPVYYKGADDECTKDNAGSLGRDWNPTTNSCCPVGTTYNPSTGTCDGDSSDNSCRIETNENGQKEYYDFDGNLISEEEYYRICPDPGNTPGGGLDPCDPNEENCSWCPDNDPCCRGYCGNNGLDVIYRTIDLDTPFPGYDGTKRQTGANWCSYEDGVLNCESSKTGDNSVVDEVVFSNRGADSNNPESAYSKEPMYELVLDADKIEEIRDYNDANEYSDFTLNCPDSYKNSNDGYCTMSSELYNLFDISGTCSSRNQSTLATCAEE